MRSPDLAVVDVETTGFAYTQHDRIVEIAIVRTDFDGNVQATFESLVNPGRDVGPTHIHGITAEMVSEAPPFQELVDAVLEVLDGTYWVAHNAPFDVNFLSAEAKRAGERIDNIPHVCTLKATRAIYPNLPSKKLERVCEFLDIRLEHAHTALSDAQATRQLLEILRGEQPGLIPRSHEPFHSRRSVRSVGIETLSRGQFEEERSQGASPIKDLLGRLPSVESDDDGAEAYANLLDEVLLDRIVTDEELESITSIADEYGVSEEKAEGIHLEYLRNLIRYTLLDDAITEPEREDIRKVQKLLGLEGYDLDSLVHEIRDGLDSAYTEDLHSVDESLRGKSVCFTGSLVGEIDGEPISRSTAQRLAYERGMVVKKHVTKSLDYLVAADPHSQSGKAKKARRYDIPIIAEVEYWRRLGVSVE